MKKNDLPIRPPLPKGHENFIVISDKEIIQKLKQVGAWVENEEELKLPLLEALYFTEKKVLDKNFDELMKKLNEDDPLAEDRYIVLRYLRNNGYITRVSLDTVEFFRVYQKGFRPGEDRTKYIVKVVPKDWNPKLDEIKSALEFSGNLRKELIFAYVEGKAVRFMKMGRTNFE